MKKFTFIIFIFSFCLIGCESERPANYILKEKELVPEGIAYSESTNLFYLTSIAKSKIITVDKNSGEQTDFISEGEFGFMPGVGIYVDDNRNLLHALCGYYMTNDSITSLFTFDISSKKLLKRANVNDDGEHFLNDLVIDKKGNIYITDTKAAAVYLLEHGADSLKLFYKSDEILYPNGIAISEDNTKLYVASYTNGVRVIDIRTKTILNEVDSTENSQGIDGLEFYKGNLYAVQNGIDANGYNFRKLELNNAKDKIAEVKLIDSDNPDLNLPLTFCTTDNQAVVIGNSNLQFLDQVTLTFLYPDSLKKTKLLIYNLD